MRLSKLWLSAVAAGCAVCTVAWSDDAKIVGSDTPSTGAAIAQIRFTFDHPQMVPSHYTITVQEDGKGHYQSQPGSEGQKDLQNALVSQPLDRDITISEPTRDLLFSTARKKKFFAMTCDSQAGKVAFRGNKELAYQGKEGEGACKFNWSKDSQIDKVTSLLQSISFTLEEGDRLAVEYRHDRLALDSELAMLIEAAKSDRAAEMHNIAPQLEAIAADEQIMDRARQRARQLLQDAPGR